MDLPSLIKSSGAIVVVLIGVSVVYLVVDKKDKFLLATYWLWVAILVGGLIYTWIEADFWQKKPSAYGSPKTSSTHKHG